MIWLIANNLIVGHKLIEETIGLMKKCHWTQTKATRSPYCLWSTYKVLFLGCHFFEALILQFISIIVLFIFQQKI
jgi:hypothetical protein